MGTRAWQTIGLKAANKPFREAEEHSPEAAAALAIKLQKGLRPIRECSLEEAFRDAGSPLGKIAIGAYPSGFVILGFDTANDLICDAKKAGRLLDAVAAPELAAVVAHSVSSTWGYAIYRNGALVRASMGSDGEWYENHGSPLPEFEPDLTGLRAEKNPEGSFELVGLPEDSDLSGYDIGDEAVNRIADHYCAPELWPDMNCTLFSRPGLLSWLFRR